MHAENIPELEEGREYIVVFVHGRDRPGIVAGLASVLADANANILDISQTVMRGIFTMAMIVDVTEAKLKIEELRRRLEERGKQLGVEVSVYHMDVVRYLQRP
ncbi:hypothetical protein Pyrde_1499 [Pyrodictium delaneyi]|uniref:UPF0237 protein Pyrde_1499 n=1 Tax=Pyrodictium delaneyi TaxID=1273541 RepID=A0A0P0N4M7_9CREN|nr:ACT domain-containing protein [Pyrodictium delaneyi]ALL01542.1 hypothetical protein Pyrde_1499 [Pyrodictium delaneyi]